MMRATLLVVLLAACGGSSPAVSHPTSQPAERGEPPIVGCNRAPGDNLYQPKTPRPQGQHRVEVRCLRLLAEEQLAIATTAEEAAAFAKRVDAIVGEGFATSDTRGVLVVRFHCRPDKCRVMAAMQGDLDQAKVQGITTALDKLPMLTKNGGPLGGPLDFEIYYVVDPTLP